MLRNLKINTAILICSAFIFRILFLNIGFISSSDTQNNKNLLKSHFSSIMKRKMQIESDENSKNCIFSSIEICEEEANNNFQLKLNILSFIPFLNSYTGTVQSTDFNFLPFRQSSPHHSSEKYLIFQVFRI